MSTQASTSRLSSLNFFHGSSSSAAALARPTANPNVIDNDASTPPPPPPPKDRTYLPKSSSLGTKSNKRDHDSNNSYRNNIYPVTSSIENTKSSSVNASAAPISSSSSSKLSYPKIVGHLNAPLSSFNASNSVTNLGASSSLGMSYINRSGSAVSVDSQVSGGPSVSGSAEAHGSNASSLDKPSKNPRTNGFLRSLMGSKRPVSPNPEPPSAAYGITSTGPSPPTSSTHVRSYGSNTGGPSTSPDPESSATTSGRSVRSMKSMGALRSNVDDAGRRARSRLRAAVGFLGGSKSADSTSPVPSLPSQTGTAGSNNSMGDVTFDMDTIRGSLKGRSNSRRRNAPKSSGDPDTSISSGYVDVNGVYAGGSSAYSQQTGAAPTGDDGISTPWNFQHNLHVDEGLSGLPPSWATQLAEAGYSDEEIAALASRRRQKVGSVNLIKPSPRTTSLNPLLNGHGRHDSTATGTGGASIRSLSTRESEDRAPSPQPPVAYTYPQPPPPPPSIPPYILQQSRSRGSSISSSRSRSKTPDLPPPQPLNLQQSRPGSKSKPGSRGEQIAQPLATPPSTPLRRAESGASQLVIMNGFNSPGSPPPAYVTSKYAQTFNDRKEKVPDDEKASVNVVLGSKSSRPRQASNASASSSASGSRSHTEVTVDLASVTQRRGTDASSTSYGSNASTTATRFDASTKQIDKTSPPNSSTKRRSKRFTALPPRLSLKVDLGGSDDLTSWTEALISAIPSATEEEEQRRAEKTGLPTGASASFGAGGGSFRGPTKTGTGGSKADSKTSSASSRWEREQERIIRERNENSAKSSQTTGSTAKTQPSSSRVDSSTRPPALPASIVAVNGNRQSPASPLASPNSVGTLDSTRAVIWEEIMQLMGQNSSNMGGTFRLEGSLIRDQEPALNEAWSPTLPDNRHKAGVDCDKTQVRVSVSGPQDSNHRSNADATGNSNGTEEQSAEGRIDPSRLSSFLTTGMLDEKHDPNRDSNMSIMSTATVTNATIVRNASYAQTAVANVKVIPPRSNSPSSANGSSKAPPSNVTSPNTIASHSSATSGAGKRGELSIGSVAFIDGENAGPSPVFSSAPSTDPYGGITSSTPQASGSKPSPTQHPIARSVSVAERVAAFGGGRPAVLSPGLPSASLPSASGVPSGGKSHPASPQSSHFGSSEESSWSGGTRPSSSMSQEQHTPTTDAGESSPTATYNFKPLPQPGSYTRDSTRPPPLESAQAEAGQLSHPGSSKSPSTTKGSQPNTPLTANSLPMSPFQRYEGWVYKVVQPLEAFIDESIDPREFYLDLQEIAEGENGSVFSARLVASNKIHKLKLPPLVKAKDADNLANGRDTFVAIKNVNLLPSGSTKLDDLKHELDLLDGRCHENVLGMDAVYVDLVEDSLWIRMELMERSLADVVALVSDGLMLQERMIARFASDILLALQYLHSQRIAHRDVRSDNLLINSQGILKLGDFSNAIEASSEDETRSDIVGVPYWQAPEIRSGPYLPLKVDVWSLGATVWEMAEAEPPFASDQKLANRWPPLSQPDIYSPSFHDFLRLCSDPSPNRPDPSDLIKKSFVQNACGRQVIMQLLSQCMAIESSLQDADDAQGPS